MRLKSPTPIYFLVIIVVGVVIGFGSSQVKAQTVSPVVQEARTWANGSAKVGIVLFKFANDTSADPFTPEQARDRVFGGHQDTLRDYYKEVSGGKLIISGKNNKDGGIGRGDVYGWYKIGLGYDQNLCLDLPTIFANAAK